MTKRMGDSTNSWDIPQNVDMAAGYVNGVYVWNALSWARWIGKPIRRICVDGSDVGDTLDVERGDAYPWQAPGWAVAARARGVVDPWVYVNLSNWGPTRTEFQLRGVPEPLWWVADYDNDPTIPAGAVAKQYANATFTGGHYDLSSVSDAAFGGATQHRGADMPQFVIGPTPPGEIWAIDGSARHVGPAEWSKVWQRNEAGWVKPVPTPVDATALAEIKASVASGIASGNFTISGAISGAGTIK